jgi:peptidoglycan/xylan/chitin deacetylase (PgdA/CDA1 family)
MHDVSAKTTTVDALPVVIEGLFQQGFQFSVMGKNTFHYRFVKNVK